MAKRSKPQARRQGSSRTPVWAWLLVGLFVGALAFFSYQQYRALTAPKNTAIPIPQTNNHDSADNEKTTEPPASGMQDGVLNTDYSFYNVLPSDQTTGIQEPDASPEAPNTSAAAAPNTHASEQPQISDNVVSVKNPVPATDPTVLKKTPPASHRYILQAGAFERNADAEDLKARIALSGESAQIEPAEVNGKTVYRVRLGPYPSSAATDSAQTALMQQGLNTTRITLHESAFQANQR